MSEESTTPDLVELTCGGLDAANRQDIDAVMSPYGPNAVLDLSDAGMGTFEGVAAIRSFIQDWWRTWGHLGIEVEEIVDLGYGVVFSSLREDAHLRASGGRVEHRRGWVYLWVQGMIERQTGYLEIDDARAAAERLAGERE